MFWAKNWIEIDRISKFANRNVTTKMPVMLRHWNHCVLHCGVSYAVIASGCAGCPKLHCERPGCGMDFCYHCKQPWHANQTCATARAKRMSSAHSLSSMSHSLDSNIGSCAASMFNVSFLTIWRPLLRYGYSYKASYTRLGLASFVILDKWGHWRSGLSVREPVGQKLQMKVWHRMLYSCTHGNSSGQRVNIVDVNSKLY